MKGLKFVSLIHDGSIVTPRQQESDIMKFPIVDIDQRVDQSLEYVARAIEYP